MPLAWICSSTTSSNLLVKLLYQREPQTLTLLATDLRGVYYESLRGRQLNRRIDDAVASSSSDTQAESIGVMAGVGHEGAALAERILDELVDATTSGRAKAEMTEEGFDVGDIPLPNAERVQAEILLTHSNSSTSRCRARRSFDSSCSSSKPNRPKSSRHTSLNPSSVPLRPCCRSFAKILLKR